MKSKPAATSSILRILGVVAPLVLLLFWWIGMANFLVGRALMIAYPGIEVTSKGAWFEWDGDVTAKDVVILPFDVDDETAIRAERAHVEVPGGWFWFLRNLFDRKLSRAKMDRVHLTLHGVVSPGGIEPSLGDLGPFGAASASPFEAEGCMADSMWVREELEEMGLSPEPTRLEFDYGIDGATLTTTVTLDTPRASRVQYQRRSRIAGSGNALLLDSTPTQILAERWEVHDQGFVAARNRYCGKKDGIDARRFLDRHIESIERLTEVMGLAWNADTRTTYKRFARDGGTLRFGGEYAKPIAGEIDGEMYVSGEAVAMLHAKLEHNGRGAPVAWQRVAPLDLPGLEDGEPTYALILRERRNGPAPAAAATPPTAVPATAADGVAVAPAGPPPAAAATEATVAAAAPDSAAAVAATAEPAGDSAAATAAPTTPPPGATAADATPAPVAAPAATSASPTPADPAVEATAGVAAPSGAAPGAAAPPPVPAHLAAAGVAALSPEARARIKVPSNAAPVAPADGLRPGAPLEWPQLLTLRGRMVRIWTMHNPPRTVEILSTEGNALRVVTRVGGGNAEYTIQREGFLRASLIR